MAIRLQSLRSNPAADQSVASCRLVAMQSSPTPQHRRLLSLALLALLVSAVAGAVFERLSAVPEGESPAEENSPREQPKRTACSEQEQSIQWHV